MLLEIVAGVAIGALGVVPFLHANVLIEVARGLGGGALFVAIAFARLAFEPFGAYLLGAAGPTQNVAIAAARELGATTRVFEVVLQSIFLSALVAFAALPLALAALPPAYEFVQPWIAAALAAVAALPFLQLRGLRQALAALTVWVLASLIGYIALRSALAEPLFPLLTGLFGLPALLVRVHAKEGACAVDAVTILVGVALGWLSVLLPALSPALVACLALVWLEQRPGRFLCLASAIIGSRAVFELAALVAIDKARSGYAAALQRSSFDGSELAAVAAAALAALGIAILAALLLKGFAARAYALLDCRAGRATLIAALAAALLAVSGGAGLVLAVSAAGVGVLPLMLKLPRTYLVGALLTPTIAWYLGL